MSKFISKVSNPQTRYLKGLTQTDQGQFIVACSNKRGLIQLDSSCLYVQHVAHGSFADVQYHTSENCLYALEIEQSKIVVFQYVSEQWCFQREFRLHHGNTHARDRLAVCDKELLVSSCNNNCLYVFSVDGEFKYQTGETGTGEAGHLSGPLLCNVDAAGNVLVADYSNHRLQVCERDSQWCIVILPGVVNSPMDALTDDTADNTWVITNQPEQLLKFTM